MLPFQYIKAQMAELEHVNGGSSHFGALLRELVHLLQVFLALGAKDLDIGPMASSGSLEDH